MFFFQIVDRDDDDLPDILQFAPVNVISVEDCQDDFSFINEQHICIRDPTGEHGACFVSSIFTSNCHPCTLNKWGWKI